MLLKAVIQTPFRSLISDFDHSHFHNRTPLSLRFSASEVTLSGFTGGEYFPLPAEFLCCSHAVLQCCCLKDECTLRDNGVLQNSGNTRGSNMRFAAVPFH